MLDVVSEDKATKQKTVGGARPGAGAPKGNTNRRTHGLGSLNKAWSQLGNRTIDGPSPAAVALRKWRQDIIEDLGGPDAISARQKTIIKLASGTKLMLDSTDAWIMAQRSIVNARKRALIPVVLQRQTLADALARYMAMLGLDRRNKVKTITDLLNGSTEQPESDARQ